MAWPKLVTVRGLQFPVDSWEEFDELVGRFGGEAMILAPASTQEGQPATAPARRSAANGGHGGSQLAPPDRSLLQGFIEGERRGLLTNQIGPALGAKGKGIRPALERWSRKIGLVTEDRASAFEPVKRVDGRAYRLTEVHSATARAMLGS